MNRHAPIAAGLGVPLAVVAAAAILMAIAMAAPPYVPDYVAARCPARQHGEIGLPRSRWSA